jgi:O-antigen ligase
MPVSLSSAGYLLCLAILAASLTGRPGITGDPPIWQYIASGPLCLNAGLQLWKHKATSRPACLYCLFVLCASAVASLPASVAPRLSYQSLASMAGFVGIAISVAFCSATMAGWRRVATALVTIAGIHSLGALWLYAQKSGAGPLQANFTNPDTYSLIPMLAFFPCLALATHSPIGGRVLFGAQAILLAGTVLLTASRAAALALTVGFFAFVATLLSSSSARKRRAARRLLLVPALALLVILCAGDRLHLTEKFLKVGQKAEAANIKSRYDVARYGYRSFLRSPLVGSGIGCFHLIYQQDRPALVAGEDYMNVAHNDFVQWFIETGAVGGCAWILLLACNLKTAWTSFRAPAPWAAAQVGSGLAMLVFCGLNFAAPVPVCLLWMGATLGLTLGLRGQPDKSESGASWIPKNFPAFVALVGLGAWSFYQGWQAWQLERLNQAIALSEKSLDWETAARLAQEVSSAQPYDASCQLQVARQARRAYLFSGKAIWLRREEQALLRALEVSPRDLRTLMLLARHYEARFRDNLAQPFIEQAAELAPSNPHVRRAVVRHLIRTGQFAKAAEGLAETEAVGVVVDDATLALLVSWLEIHRPSRGLALVKKLEPERSLKVGLGAAEQAGTEGQHGAALLLLAELSTRFPDSLKVALQQALEYGRAGQSRRELEEIERLRSSAQLATDPEIERQVWQRWADLQQKAGKRKLVTTELKEFLQTHPREFWARQTLTGILSASGAKGAARETLAEGLRYDEDGSVRLRLGELCESQGLSGLALSYYEEASSMSASSRETVEPRLGKLRKIVEEELDSSEGLTK